MSTRVAELTDDNFRQHLDDHKPVLVDFWAPWCGPCRMLAPTIDALASKYAGRVTVAKVNVDDNPLMATRYNVRGIPTLGFFRAGELVHQVVGVRPQQELEQELDRVLAMR